MSKQYILPVGEVDKARLEAQHLCYKKGIVNAVSEDLCEGQVVVDVGCGNGVMTEWLANRVGPNGMVYAIGNSDAQIKIAQDRIQRANLKQVEFIQFDLNQAAFLDLKADLAYCCYVLQHFEKVDQGLKNIAQITKPGGSIVIVETLNSYAWVNPINTSFERMFNLFRQYTSMKGVDSDYGKNIINLCNRSKYFDQITIDGYHPITDDPAKKAMLFLQWLNIRDDLKRSRLISDTEYENMTQELKVIAENDSVMGLPPCAIVNCKKKS